MDAQPILDVPMPCRSPLPLKVCGCGRSYTYATWAQLRYVGVMHSGSTLLELRDCLCGSTISIKLGPQLLS